MRPVLRPALVALLALAACGDAEKPFTELEGIYQITSWTENDAGCAAEGPSVLDGKTEKLLWLKVGTFGPVRFLGLVTCADLPACRGDSAGDVPLFGAWIFGAGGAAAAPRPCEVLEVLEVLGASFLERLP